MRILLTNDDGLDAPGIAAMYDAIVGVGTSADTGTNTGMDTSMDTGTDTRTGTGTSDGADQAVGSALGEVFVAAPLTVQSATGHGATFHTPMTTRRVRVNDRMVGVAVDGRPADCIKLALTELWPQRFGVGTRPDLVISGMNAGANYGINVIYSGTVAAALEAAIAGVPAIAVSLHLGPDESDFGVAAIRARKAIDRVLGSGLLRAHACVSINIPRTARGADPDALLRMCVCPMNAHGMIDRYHRVANPGGDDAYLSTHAVKPDAQALATPASADPLAAAHTGFEFQQTDTGSDVAALLGGAITVTPLVYDLTDHAALGAWRKALGK